LIDGELAKAPLDRQYRFPEELEQGYAFYGVTDSRASTSGGTGKFVST